MSVAGMLVESPLPAGIEEEEASVAGIAAELELPEDMAAEASGAGTETEPPASLVGSTAEPALFDGWEAPVAESVLTSGADVEVGAWAVPPQAARSVRARERKRSGMSGLMGPPVICI